MFMSNERMDRGPRGIAHSLSEEAERGRQPPAEHREAGRLDAVLGCPS
jgi:hypothetical protein